MMRFKREDGFVSLIACILISLLLLIVTMSVISLETLQLRKSEDAEQSLRAYYTAESGIESAVGKILSGAITPASGNQTCASPGAANTAYDTAGASGWTCQQITFTGNPAGNLDQPDVATTVDPSTTAPEYHSVIVEWNESNNPNAASFTDNALSFPCNSLSANCTSANWNYAAPPLELSVVQYPSGGFDASQVCGTGAPAGCNVKLGNVVFVPDGAALVSSGGVKDYGTISGGGPVAAHCGPLPQALPGALGGGSIPYNCYAVLTNLDPASSGYDFLFRLRSRYNSTAYQMVFKQGTDGSGAIVSVPNNMAMIDVTARAGQAYRRVISSIPLGSSASGSLNYVMYSDTNICKNFNVISNIAQPGCPY